MILPVCRSVDDRHYRTLTVQHCPPSRPCLTPTTPTSPVTPPRSATAILDEALAHHRPAPPPGRIPRSRPRAPPAQRLGGNSSRPRPRPASTARGCTRRPVTTLVVAGYGRAALDRGIGSRAPTSPWARRPRDGDGGPGIFNPPIHLRDRGLPYLVNGGARLMADARRQWSDARCRLPFSVTLFHSPIFTRRRSALCPVVRGVVSPPSAPGLPAPRGVRLGPQTTMVITGRAVGRVGSSSQKRRLNLAACGYVVSKHYPKDTFAFINSGF